LTVIEYGTYIINRNQLFGKSWLGLTTGQENTFLGVICGKFYRYNTIDLSKRTRRDKMAKKLFQA